MKTLAKRTGILLLGLLTAASAAFGQAPAPQGRPAFTQPELEQMLAPIALYPDTLLSQVLISATYPLEVVQAARWSRSFPGLRGDDAVRAVDDRDWDPGVKSLVAFPQVLQMMDERLEWTERVGDAFLAQEDQVMQEVQELRRKANAAGNLASNAEMVVQRQGSDLVIEPPTPEEMYVPYYDPRTMYGDWQWPDYQPEYWAPWAGYSYSPGGFGWGVGIPVSVGFFFSTFDWPRHNVRISSRPPFYFNGGGRRPGASPGSQWQHDPDHRRGVPYRDPALRQQLGRWNPATDARREFRGHEVPAPAPAVRSEASARPSGQQPGFFAPSAQQQQVAPVAAPGTQAPRYRYARPVESPPQALEGVGRGQEARDSSARGQQSFQAPVYRQRAAAPQAPQASQPSPIARPQAGEPSHSAPQQSRPAEGGNPAARGRQER
jgi:hypothetical protein